jgi:adenylate kinase family enzyme
VTVLLIDGRSGSGKTELARVITAGLPVTLLSLDDVYPGWGGLAAAAEALPQILRERRWQRYDWSSSSLAEWNELGNGDLVVEGCGAVTRASRELADCAIWVEHPPALRRARALEREPGFAEHWDEWAAQEDAHIARENPRALADAFVDGTDVTAGVERWRAMLGA